MRAIDADKMKADLLTVDPQFETMIDWCISVLDAQPEISRMVIGKPSGGTTMWYECEGCGEPVDPGDRYCRKCGRKLINE